MKTKQEIVDEELEFRKTHPRCSNLHACYYYLDGNMCAVGRVLRNPKKHAHNDNDAATLFGCSTIDVVNSLMLKPEYRGHEAQFWLDLQEQHDKGRTESGNLSECFLSRWNLK